MVGGVGLFFDRGVDFFKEDIIYKGLDIRKYTDGEKEKNVSLVLDSNNLSYSENQDGLYKTKDEMDKFKKVDSRKVSISSNEKITYERSGYLCSTNGYFEEKVWDVVESILGTIRGKGIIERMRGK